MIGKTLGHYEILEPLGAGGMGEVYRAWDGKLERHVAVKLVPEELAGDSSRMARLEREARLLAALQHGNIAVIHGLEEDGGTRFLVLELVQGESLERRLTRGALAVDEALDLGRQIAAALEAAHEAGIIHRDLKPANVVVTPDGTAKVLDLGIGKAIEPRAPRDAAAETTALTVDGALVGTVPYMSPEQVRGDDVDRRADIWSFGCLMYEMLTGRRPFDRETAADTLAAILEVEPDLDRLPDELAPALRRLLRRCLEKNPRQRLRDIGDARIEIEEAQRAAGPYGSGAPGMAPSDAGAPGEGPPGRGAAPGRPGAEVETGRGLQAPGSELAGLPSAPSSRALRAFPWIAGIALGVGAAVLAGALGYGPFRPSRRSSAQQATGPTAGKLVRFPVPLPPGNRLTGLGGQVVAVSPDGLRFAYLADRRVHVREMDSMAATPLRGTQIGGSRFTRDVFFSHDGLWIGFTAGGQLWKVSTAGGEPRALWPIDDRPARAHWAADDTIWSGGPGGVWRGPAAGGTPERVITVADGERACCPQPLPDGEWVLYSLRPAGAASLAEHRVVVESLATGDREILAEGRYAVYVPSSRLPGPAEAEVDRVVSPPSGGSGEPARGHIVYVAGSSLIAVPFDAASHTVTGDPARVVESVYVHPYGAPHFSVSAEGTLVVLPEASISSLVELVWVDRDGNETSTGTPPRDYGSPRVSPGGTMVLVRVNDPDGGPGGFAYWDADDAVLRPLSVEPRGFTAWAHDGASVVFTSERPDGARDLRSTSIAGGGASELLFTAPREARPFIGLAGGGLVFVQRAAAPGGGMDILRFRPGEAEPQPLLASEAHESRPVLSPDGNWLAFESDASGRPEVWVVSFPDVTRFRQQITTGGGVEPQWSPSGHELYYVDPGEGRMMAVPVETGDTFSQRAAAEPLFSVDDYDMPVVNNPNYDVAPDGRFLFMRPSDAPGATVAGQHFVVVLGWFEELVRLAPAGR